MWVKISFNFKQKSKKLEQNKTLVRKIPYILVYRPCLRSIHIFFFIVHSRIHLGGEILYIWITFEDVLKNIQFIKKILLFKII